MIDCVFCKIVEGKAPAVRMAVWDDCVAFVPLNPVTRGHLLVIPRFHVVDALQDPMLAGRVFARAASIAAHDCNLITSAGSWASQTIFHFHVHIVPRSNRDALRLPWPQEGDE